jgi:hypothetical protein
MQGRRQFGAMAPVGGGGDEVGLEHGFDQPGELELTFTTRCSR